MSDTMLDRVACAIYSSLDQACQAEGADQWRRASADDKALYRHMAAAALRTLREPTPEIAAALTRRWAELQSDEGLGGIPELLWELMIIEILEETDAPITGAAAITPSSDSLAPFPSRKAV
ncbi:hypothetical protein [Arenibaculum pallidiluteum]|uniref:hypothetical protein n=1 Tax=Arenibaculum pallidiluteum TaxID=2812559 RepID=UPI001A97A5DD|nr:hypothetical protein [Arenibaculum pallidiluteum]